MNPTFITVKVAWDSKWEYMMPVVAFLTPETIDFDIIHGAN